MIDMPCCILDRGGYIIRLQIWKIFKDFGASGARRKHIEDVLYPDPQPANAGATAENFRIDRDAFEAALHGVSS